MSQLALAGPEFTKRYLRSVERCTLIPSLPVIEFFARRLEVPAANLLRANVANHKGAGPITDKELSAAQEDLNYQFVYAKMLIKDGSLEDAFAALDRTESYLASLGKYAQKLPPQLLHRLPCLRGLAHLQAYDAAAALPELTQALALVESDEGASAHVRNLLGAAYYLQERPSMAIKEHLICLRAIQNGTLHDNSYKFSIYRNLANDYWVLGDAKQALAMYRLALPILQDLNDPPRNAAIFYGMGMAYWELEDKVSALLWCVRAKEVYQDLGQHLDVAETSLDIAEILISDGRGGEAEPFLKGASDILLNPESGAGDLLHCQLYRVLAIFALDQGLPSQAEEYVQTSLKYGSTASVAAVDACALVTDSSEGSDRKIRPGSACYPIRAYVDTLHLAARIAEKEGRSRAADELFTTGLDWAEKTGAQEVIRAISLGYARTMEQRGDLQPAMAYYKAAAQANLPLKRKTTGQGALVG